MFRIAFAAPSLFGRIFNFRIIRTKTLKAAWRLDSNPRPLRGLSGICGQFFPRRANSAVRLGGLYRLLKKPRFQLEPAVKNKEYRLFWSNASAFGCSPYVMPIDSVNFEQPFKCNSICLLKRQEVLACLQDKSWAHAIAARANAAFQVYCIRITFKSVGKPAKPVLLAAVSCIEPRDIMAEIRLGQRGPYAESKCCARRADDWQFQDTANEKILSADNAKILRKKIALESQRAVCLILFSASPIIGTKAGKVEHALVKVPA